MPSALVAVVLGILFKGQNVAFMVGLAFAVACSANFPPLLLSIVWRRFNTAGAVASIVAGALISVMLIVLSPTIWVDLLHKPAAIFPLRNPAIVSMPLSFSSASWPRCSRASPRRKRSSTTRSCGRIWAWAPSSAGGRPPTDPSQRRRPALRCAATSSFQLRFSFVTPGVGTAGTGSGPNETVGGVRSSLAFTISSQVSS